MNRKSACALLCSILLLLAGCIVVPFTPYDGKTLATIEDEMVVGVVTRESLRERLGQPDAMYELGRLWVFADPDFERGLFYIDLNGNSSTTYRGDMLFLITKFDEQGRLSSFRLEQLVFRAGAPYRNCTQSRFCISHFDVSNYYVYRLATEDEEASVWSFPHPGERCDVYLYYPKFFSAGSHSIVLNGENMGKLGFWREGSESARSFFHWQLEPGDHLIDVYSWNDADRKKPQTRHVFACRAGERLFFEFDHRIWRLASVKALVPVEEARGKKQVKKLRLLAPISEGPPDASIDKPQSGTWRTLPAAEPVSSILASW